MRGSRSYQLCTAESPTKLVNTCCSVDAACGAPTYVLVMPKLKMSIPIRGFVDTSQDLSSYWPAETYHNEMRPKRRESVDEQAGRHENGSRECADQSATIISRGPAKAIFADELDPGQPSTWSLIYTPSSGSASGKQCPATWRW